ncbi:MAG TPA: hypothetical protein VGO00_27160, partial [Kofleriaceae bacterium]|nr:hypothetical protein [Kofleriaceae bacterium]
MSDGPFRDDQEAALARAEALDLELAREKAENDRLRAENARLRRRRNSTARRPVEPAPVPHAKPASRRAKLGVTLGAMLVVGIAGTIAWQVKSHRIASREAYDQAVADRQLQSQRWRAYITVVPAIHRAEQDSIRVRAMDAAAADPRINPMELSNPDLLTCRCTTELDKLARLPAPIGAAFSHWRDVESKLVAMARRIHDYWSKGDWKDDGYRMAPALLADLDAVLDERSAVFIELRRDAVPFVERDMRAMQAAHLARHGKDITWWNIEVGFAVVDIVEAAHVARLAAPSDADAIRRAIAPRVEALIAATKQAPIEIVRA